MGGASGSSSRWPQWMAGGKGREGTLPGSDRSLGSSMTTAHQSSKRLSFPGTGPQETRPGVRLGPAGSPRGSRGNGGRARLSAGPALGDAGAAEWRARAAAGPEGARPPVPTADRWPGGLDRKEGLPPPWAPHAGCPFPQPGVRKAEGRHRGTQPPHPVAKLLTTGTAGRACPARRLLPSLLGLRPRGSGGGAVSSVTAWPQHHSWGHPAPGPSVTHRPVRDGGVAAVVSGSAPPWCLRGGEKPLS